MHDMPMEMTMQMTFAWSQSPTILFDNWKPSTPGEYFGALLAVFLMGVSFELVKYISFKLDKKLLQASSASSQNTDKQSLYIQSSSKAVTFSFGAQALRALLHMVQITISYLLMLVVMTYNGGLFIAAVLGVVFGFFLFTRSRSVALEDDPCH